MNLTPEILMDAMHEGAKIKIEFTFETHEEAVETIKEYAEAFGREWMEIKSELGNWYSFQEGTEEEENAYEVNVFVWVPGQSPYDHEEGES